MPEGMQRERLTPSLCTRCRRWCAPGEDRVAYWQTVVPPPHVLRDPWFGGVGSVEVEHLSLFWIETDPDLGSPHGQICKKTFKFILGFDNDGNIVYVNKSIRVLCNQLLQQQFIYDGEEQRGARASFFHSSSGFLVDALDPLVPPLW